MQLGNQKISSLFKTYVRATLEIEKDRNLPWLRSVFHDNAGVVAFDSQIDVAIKVERIIHHPLWIHTVVR